MTTSAILAFRASGVNRGKVARRSELLSKVVVESTLPVKVFLTNLPVSRPLKIIDQYDLRSEIENRGFRELKQGYHLLKYPQRTEAAVRAHAVLTVIIYSMVNAYKSKQGQRLAHLGIRRWRGKQMGDSIHKMIVYYDRIYGIVDVEELFYLMDMTPKELYRLKINQLQREIE
jgi:hypothetical protein